MSYLGHHMEKKNRGTIVFYRIRIKILTVVTGELNARGSRKQTVAAFPPTHARRL